jgi:hypothetical protein
MYPSHSYIISQLAGILNIVYSGQPSMSWVTFGEREREQEGDHIKGQCGRILTTNRTWSLLIYY